MNIDTLITALLIAWPINGIGWLLLWKFRQPDEITLFEIACILLIGSAFGVLIPLAAFLHSVKIRKAKDQP